MVVDDWDDCDLDDYDRCYECTGYGDDYYFDENGELVWACADCIYNRNEPDD